MVSRRVVNLLPHSPQTFSHLHKHMNRISQPEFLRIMSALLIARKR